MLIGLYLIRCRHVQSDDRFCVAFLSHRPLRRSLPTVTILLAKLSHATPHHTHHHVARPLDTAARKSWEAIIFIHDSPSNTVQFMASSQPPQHHHAYHHQCLMHVAMPHFAPTTACLGQALQVACNYAAWCKKTEHWEPWWGGAGKHLPE